MAGRWFAAIIFIVCSVSASAQQTHITGRVVDASTSEPLGFANVLFKSSGIGLYTDSLGRFDITSPRAETIVEVSTVGYKSEVIKLKDGKGSDMTISLSPLSISLNEVLIKPQKRKKRVIDTVAQYVLAQVIENKPLNNPQHIPNYRLHEHNKLIISLLNVPEKFVKARIFRPFSFFFERRDTTESGSEFIPLVMQEEYNETFHQASPSINRKVVYYRRMSGLKKNFVANLVANQFEAVDIYRNVYIIAGKSFTSPFSPGAKLTYSYHMLDTIRDVNGTAYKVSFVGKNKEDVALKGYAIVDSASWGIRYIRFRPNEKANVNFLSDYSIEQQFDKSDSGWIMRSEKINAVGNLLEKQKKLSVYLTKITLHDSITLDQPIPDSVRKAKDDIIARYAFERPVSYIDSVRISPLDDAERHIYHSFDTLKTIPAYKGLDWLVNFFTSGNFKAGPVEFGRSYYMVSRNAMEGYRLRLGIFTNEKLTDKVFFYGHGAYGTRDKKWKYEGDVHIMLPTHSNRWHALWIRSKNDMTRLGQENPLLTFDNVLTLLSRPSARDKVMRVNTQNIMYERDWFKGLSTNMGLSYSRFYSIPNAYVFQRVDADGKYRDISGFNVTELTGELRYCASEQYFDSYSYRYFIPTKKPSFTFRYTWGIKNPLIGDYGYQKFEVLIKHTWRMPIIGYGKIDFRGGYMTGKVPYPVAFISSSNVSFLKDEMSFQLTNPFEFASDKYVSFWYEHHFQGLLFNQIPYVKKLKLREFITVKALYGDFAVSNQKVLSLPDGIHTANKMPYVEVGFGVENIFKVIQLNFIWRATYRDVPGAQNFGFKLGIKPGF
jgi:hypothetical protein